jgi:hypothetical protein
MKQEAFQEVDREAEVTCSSGFYSRPPPPLPHCFGLTSETGPSGRQIDSHSRAGHLDLSVSFSSTAGATVMGVEATGGPEGTLKAGPSRREGKRKEGARVISGCTPQGYQEDPSPYAS